MNFVFSVFLFLIFGFVKGQVTVVDSVENKIEKYYNIGISDSTRSHLKNQISKMDKYIAKDSLNPQAFLQRGIYYTQLGAQVKAIKDYDRATNIYWPGNKLGHGREDVAKLWNSLKNILSEIKFKIEHVGYLDEPNRNPRASIRWSLEGVHSEDSKDYGEKTSSRLNIIGINHAELNSYGVIKEWVLFDEVAIWKQILMNKNKDG